MNTNTLKKILMMVLIHGIVMSLTLFQTHSSIPTEEGLLKNLHNNPPYDGQVAIKIKVSTVEPNEESFYKIIIGLENPLITSLLVMRYDKPSMKEAQLKSIKFYPDLLSSIKKELVQHRSLFLSSLMFLIHNRGAGFESIIEKTGGNIIRTKQLYDDDKMKLLKSYKAHLVKNPGSRETNSPLNPEDQTQKEKVQSLFRSNSLKNSPNIQLVKLGNDFFWQYNQKSLIAHFTNEERRLKFLELNTSDFSSKIEFESYGILNGTNEFPRGIIQVLDGQNFKKIQILGVENLPKKEKSLFKKDEELRKYLAQPGEDKSLSSSYKIDETLF